MPKGQKLIDWTPENDARLMLTILAIENIHPNCEAVAAAFGGAVNAMSISNRLSRLRRMAAEEGLVAKGGDAAPATGQKKKGGKKGGVLAEASGGEPPASDDHEDYGAPPARKAPGKGQKVLSGRVTKARKPVNNKGGEGDGKGSDSAGAWAGGDGLDAAEGSGGEHDGGDGDDAAQVKMEEGA